MAELLLSKGYAFHGIVRRVVLEDPAHHLWRIRHLIDDLQLNAALMESCASIFGVVEQTHPDESYYLAAQSFVSIRSKMSIPPLQ